MNFKLEIAKSIAEALHTNLSAEEIASAIETPPTPEMGDFSFPCFRLAKELRKAPAAIASELAEKIQKPAFVAEIKCAAAYLNFYLDKGGYAGVVLSEAMKQGEDYGHSAMGGGRNVTVDYSSPNIAKPFHIGHLRATVIGRALYNLYRFVGYNSIGINHLGDWGTQFGKLIVAYKKWGDKALVEQNGIDELTRIYVKFHDEAERDGSLNDEARHWMLEMQNGNEEALALWSWFKEISLKEFDRIYARLKVDFEYMTGESFYNDKMDAVVQELREKNLLTESDGAMVVMLDDYNMPPCLILRSDGGTLYPTRDIAAAMYRKRTYHFDKCLYVTGLEQKLHFQQWFKVLEKMGHEWAKDLIHVPFGMVRTPEGKLSTRKGRVLRVEGLLNESVSRTLEIIQAKNPDLPNKEQVAEQVGIGALKFNDLYNSRIKDVEFDWERILNFEGESGPYVQYAHTRACSVLAKAGETNFENVDYAQLTDGEANAVVKLIDTYPDKILEAVSKNEPYIVTRHLMEIAQAFNRFYNTHNILNSEPSVKNARLALTLCVKNILRTGLGLLGIDAPEQM